MHMHLPRSSQRVVVAGASLAGLRAAEALRKCGFTGELLLVGNEHHLPYNRPPLSKDLSGERTIPDALARHGNAEDISWRLGAQIVSSDLGRRVVTLGSGEQLTWDGLVIATGLRSRLLPLPGPEAGRHRLRTFFDSVTLGRALQGARHVVVVGGGFIGCETAAATAQMGLRTHLVAPESTPLQAAVGELVGTEVRSRLTDLGVTFHLGTVPLRYDGGDRVDGVVLSNDRLVPADVVIEAVGSDPNVAWLADNDLDLTNGVLADARMRVSGRADVVACGDVARFPIIGYDDEPRRLEHWTVAVDTARVAGANLAHHLLDQEEHVAEFAAVPSFWSHLADLRIQSFGQPALGLEDVRVLEGDLRTEAAIGYHRDSDLVGVVLIGLTSRFAHYRKALGRSALALASG